MKRCINKALAFAIMLLLFIVPIFAVASFGNTIIDGQPYLTSAIVPIPIFFIGKFGPQKLSRSDTELLKLLFTPILWICFPIIPIYKVLKFLFKH